MVFDASENARILDHIPLGILILDSSHRVLFWNKCLQYWTGLGEDQVKGRDVRALFPLFAENRFASRIETIFQGGPPIIFSSHIHKHIIPAKLPNNALRLQHVTVSPLRDKNGQFRAMFTIQDVTEVNTRLTQRKKAEEDLRSVLAQLEQTNQKLEASTKLAVQKAREANRANEAKSIFLANMSHEIRTPMTGILGVLDMLADHEADQEKLKLLRMTKESANSLLKIINDILDLSKVEAGKMELHPENVRLRPLLERTFHLYSVPARAKGLHLDLVLPSNLPDPVRIDATKLEQILRNLLDNAVKFTPKGDIVLGAEVVSNDSAEAHIRFWVRDTGIGIPEKKLSTLFQPFSQADSSYAKTYGGTGLGLALCKRLAELMNGTLAVDSRPAQGSTFSVTIPVSLTSRSSCSPSAVPLRHEQNEPCDGPTIRMLVAEDDQLIQAYLSFILSGQGYKTDIVSSGREAIEAFQQNAYDMILMDIQMPEMDGLEATQRIRSIEDERLRGVEEDSPAMLESRHPRIPIIALTAYAMNEEREKFLASGMDGFSPKPIQAEHLLQEVERLLAGT